MLSLIETAFGSPRNRSLAIVAIVESLGTCNESELAGCEMAQLKCS